MDTSEFEAKWDKLSPRHKTVMILIANSKEYEEEYEEEYNKYIADKLGVSKHTITGDIQDLGKEFNMKKNVKKKPRLRVLLSTHKTELTKLTDEKIEKVIADYFNDLNKKIVSSTTNKNYTKTNTDKSFIGREDSIKDLDEYIIGREDSIKDLDEYIKLF